MLNIGLGRQFNVKIQSSFIEQKENRSDSRLYIKVVRLDYILDFIFILYYFISYFVFIYFIFIYPPDQL